VIPFVFGYIVAAKIGCAMVAELSAMRVAEEIDQLDGMGLHSLAYLGGTRFVAWRDHAAVRVPARDRLGLRGRRADVARSVRRCLARHLEAVLPHLPGKRRPALLGRERADDQARS